MNAFVLGAGLGTRLGNLTEWLPKPLIPVWHRPLAAFGFDHLLRHGVTGLVMNTHHCSEAYAAAFPEGRHRGVPLVFRHEPVLLETGGGLANVADLLGDEPFLVYNGDILSDVPLDPLWAAHRAGGFEVTLLLRSAGPGRQVGWDGGSGRVVFLRDTGDAAAPRFQFTGIYAVEPRFLRRLRADRKESVISAFLELMGEGRGLGGCLTDAGCWWDLGDVETYREVVLALPGSGFTVPAGWVWRAIHPGAEVEDGAQIDARSVIGPGARVPKGTVVEESVIWPGAELPHGAEIRAVVVRGSRERHRFFD